MFMILIFKILLTTNIFHKFLKYHDNLIDNINFVLIINFKYVIIVITYNNECEIISCIKIIIRSKFNKIIILLIFTFILIYIVILQNKQINILLLFMELGRIKKQVKHGKFYFVICVILLKKSKLKQIQIF